jgi:4-hydroxybenzoate polyprenyltransferase
MQIKPKNPYLRPYLKLMRLHQPVGIWLLFFPCAWAIILASGGVFEWRLFSLFALGAVLMRSGGCIINDIADRNIDKQVERTKNRPLASGELQVWQAVALLFSLLFLSLFVAIALGYQVLMWAAISLFPVAIYPLMKRISWWPQLFLGLVFNFGAIMGWVAVRGEVELPALLLYIGGICWTLGYDTIYAHQDKTDDAKIGVKSTALRLGDKTKPFVFLMYILAILCYALAGGGFYALIPAAIHAVWQVYFLDIDSPISARKMFLSNVWFGGLVLAGIYIQTNF